MTYAFLIKKWDRVYYTFFDLNKNGSISWDDFLILFEKVKDLRGEKSMEYKICTDSMLMVWQGLLSACKRADCMKDDNMDISLDEWHMIWKKYDAKHPLPWQNEYQKFMFFLMDTSGDKIVDDTEYATVLQLYGVSKAQALDSFKKLEMGEKGKKIEINWAEFIRLWNEYFTSTDAKKAGSHLFGPVQ